MAKKKPTQDELVSEAKLRVAMDKARAEVEIPDAWSPTDAGETVVGRFIEARQIKCKDVNGKDRNPTVLFLQPKEGDKVAVWGSANLQPQIDKALKRGLEEGDVVAVTFDGTTKTSSGFRVKLYVLAVIK